MGNKDETRPVYQRIADDLRRQIDDGTLPVGARIPSRAELKRSYEASDQTVDRAVRVLKSAGYAEGQFGRGVFVTDRAPVGTLLRSTGAVDSPFAARIAARAADPAAGPDPAGAANRAGEPPDERAGPHPYPIRAPRPRPSCGRPPPARHGHPNASPSGSASGPVTR